MLITTQDELSGYEITETLGIVKGNTVRARHIGKDILSSFRNIVGGEIIEYTKLLAESREQAIDRMIEDAKKGGWDSRRSFHDIFHYAGISRTICLWHCC